MANKRISQLPPASSPLAGGTLLPVELTTGETKRATVDSLGFLPAGSGAVLRTMQAKVREQVTPLDFGAVNNGIADDTTALKAAFDYAIPLGIPVQLEGKYLISGPIQPYATRASGELHIICKNNVQITVNPASSAFSDVLYFGTTAINNATIVGGNLTIDGANKAARGVTIRHDGANGGFVTISARLSISNIFELGAAVTRENEALSIYGDYVRVVIEQPYISGVQRTNTAGGACKGISISAFTGEVVINQPYVRNVLVPSLATADADGIATFGKTSGGTYSTRSGKVVVNEPTFVDCQGRSFKSQCSDTTVFRPRVYRQMYVSIQQSADFDFQFGNGLVIEPQYVYRLNGAISPLGTSHSCVSFQQVLDDAPMYAKSVGGVLMTEVLVPRYSTVVQQSGSLYSESEVAGLRVVPIGALATTAISRAVIETDISTTVAKTAKTKLVVKNVSGPIQCYGIGYTGYTTGSLTAKFTWEVTDCYNTLSVTGSARPFNALSGSSVTAVESFLMRNNFGFRDLLTPWTFTFNTLVPGCVFTVDIANVTATGAPGWGASGYAVIEVITCWFSDTDKAIRVTKDDATVANTVFYTQNGGATWGTIK